MRILLINPPIGDRKYIKFPLGLGYIAAVLVKDGHQVEVLDINAFRYPDDEVEEKLKSIEFDVAGLTGLLTEYKYIKWLAAKIHELKPGSKIILGGGLGTLAPQLMLEKCNTDFVVVSEGERSVIELVKAIETNGDLSRIRGIAFKKDVKAVINPPVELISDLDEIPFPEWELFPMEHYTSPSYLRLFGKNVKSMNMITSRGCPYNCTYCFKGAWGSKYRNRSAGNIIEEIKLLKEKYGINGIQFNDDTFVLNKKVVIEFCNKVIEQNLGIIWMTNGRVNLMDRELLSLMRKAGCRAICYGIESGSQKILNDMKKGVTVEQAKKAVKETWEAGILPHGYIMFGMPNDTKETIGETIKLCKELSLVGRFSVVTPIPGSELWEQAKAAGEINHSLEYYLEKWSEWKEDVMINMTSMGDEELLRLKKKAEKAIFFGNMPFKLLRHYRILKPGNIIREGLIRVKEVFK